MRTGAHLAGRTGPAGGGGVPLAAEMEPARPGRLSAPGAALPVLRRPPDTDYPRRRAAESGAPQLVARKTGQVGQEAGISCRLSVTHTLREKLHAPGNGGDDWVSYSHQSSMSHRAWPLGGS